MIVNEGGGGGKKLPTLTSPASASQILTGRQAIDQNGEILTGSMVNRGAVTQALNAGGSYTIPAGYHNGTGRVNANSLASQTSATAVAADIKSGKTAWVNGAKVIGTGNVPEKTTFGFLCHGLYDSVRVNTDLAPDGEYVFTDGDRSAHTLECTVGSIVAVYCRDERDLPSSRQTGFQRMSQCAERGRSGIIVFRCTDPEGTIDMPNN